MRKVQTIQKVPFLAPDVQTAIVPAPTDGWDAISPLASMDPKRAPILDNWVPRPGYVELRQGYYAWSYIGTVTPIESLMVYRPPSGETMFAAANGKIYDVTTQNMATEVLTGLNSNRWQYVNFTPAGSTPVIQCVNGADTLKQWNGTVWSTPSITGLPGGLTTASIININAQKRRLWYVLANSTIAAFMPTDAITGPIAGYQDFGALWTKGGYIVAMADWTIDGGNGPQDYALFLSSRGQVTIYSGVDPTNATDWQLVGTFDIAPPIGRRCFLRLGSEVAIITEQGVLPISQSLPFDPGADRSVAITARIQNAMAAASMVGRSFFGWQLVSFPNQQLVLLNVPVEENVEQVQYVMNSLTGAWCRFTGWNANCFEIFNGNLYWGGNVGEINQGYSGALDLTTGIDVDLQCAFNWFQDPGRVKHMTMVQPLLVSDGNITPTLAVDEDFDTSTAINPISISAAGARWDSALWDSDVWPTGSRIYKNWLSVNAIGHALALRLRTNINTSSLTTASGFDVGVFDTAVFDGVPNGIAPVLQINAFNAILEKGGAI